MGNPQSGLRGWNPLNRVRRSDLRLVNSAASAERVDISGKAALSEPPKNVEKWSAKFKLTGVCRKI